MKVKLVLACLFVFWGTTSLAQNVTGAQDELIVLPLLGYSDEQGLGVGANAAWLGVLNSSWDANAELFASALYQQTYLSGSLVNRRLFDVLYVEIGGLFNHSSRSLFYGLGNSSSLANVSQYSIVDNYAYGRVGYKITQDIALGVGYSHRSTSIDRGSDFTLPQLQDMYSGLPRLSGTTTTSTEIFALYDTRTPVLAPRAGDYILATLDQAQPRSGEDLAQQRFILTAERYWDAFTDVVLVTRVRYEHEWGEDVPFFLQAKIGGASTLRAFKTNRFIDAASMLANLEPRWTFWTPEGHVFQRFELSAAYEFGRVFNYENIPPIDSYHPGWDFGLTGVFDNGVPLRLDYATGPEGPLFYLHIFYPF